MKTTASLQNDLTQGSVLRQLIKYAVPMVTSSLLQALYSMADMIIAGHYIGSAGISAINNASQMMGLITNFAIGLTVGGNILIGQYFGSGERTRRAHATGTLISLSLLLAVIGTAGVYLGAPAMLTALGAPSLAEATDYLRICAAGMVFIFGYNALSAVLRAVGNSKQPLYFVAASTALNVVLDLVFVGGLSMGTRGAALATVISQGVSFALALIFMLRSRELFGLSWDSLRLRWRELRMILRLGIPSSLQMIIGSISWLTVTFLINGYGVDVSAGNGVSIKIKDFCGLFISAMANGAATMIAQNLGARLFDRAKRVMYTAMGITLVMAAFIIVVVELFAPQLARLFTEEPAVIDAAVRNLRIEIISEVFYAMFLVYHALAIGAGHAIFAMSSSFVNCILVRVILAFLFNHWWGITGVYLACMIAPSSSVPLGMWYTRSGLWRRSLADAQAKPA